MKNLWEWTLYIIFILDETQLKVLKASRDKWNSESKSETVRAEVKWSIIIIDSASNLE